MSEIHNPIVKYRPEIDGLRTVAVMPVIFFHAGFSVFSGGYVGVDIFFVISGYLITSIILRELENQRFSIARFYERRARRILPALTVVLLICTPLAWTGMLPDELRRYGQSMIAVATFSSNLYFWRTTDYFAPNDDYPLLHTWSLAVEEQYYLLFPLLLMLFFGFGRTRVMWLTAGLAALSLALCEWGQKHHAVATFYLLPTRGWELLTGSLIAFIPGAWADRLRDGSPLPQLGAAAGLGMIVCATVLFDQRTPFPGLYATIPVVGTALIILCCGRKGLVYHLLCSRPFVAIGLISYSAYLWHQPVLVILRKVIDSNHDFALFASLALSATMVLAAVTFRFVERPFRLIQTPHILRSAVITLATIALVSLPVLGTSDSTIRPVFSLIESNSKVKAYAQWVDHKLVNDMCGVDSDEYGIIRCELGAKTGGGPDFVLWGDSLAGSLAYGLDQSLKERGFRATAYITDGCPPILEFRSAVTKKCTERTHSMVLKSILATSAARVIYLGNVQFVDVDPCCTIDGRPAVWDIAREKLLLIERKLREAGKQLVFVQQGPYFPEAAAAFYLRNELFGRPDSQRQRHMEIGIASYNAATAQLKGLRDQISYLDTDVFFCRGDICRAKDEDDELLIYDTTHYTHHGSYRFAQFILSRIGELPPPSN